MQAINTALCSYGMSGRLFHAPFIETNPKFNFYGVLERTKNLTKTKYPHIQIFRSLDEMLEDKNIELVIVNTPNITHFEYTKKVIKAGKHVVVEKPFTSNVQEAKELIELAKTHQIKLSVFHNRRWDSDFQTVKKIVESKKLGEIVEAEIHYDRFEPNLSYKTHKEIPSEGVGNIYDLGSHIIDQALILFGMPKKLFANIDTFRKNSKVDDYFDIKLYYQSHYVTLKSSYFTLEPIPAYIIHGTKGTFKKSKADRQESDLNNEMLPTNSNWGIESNSERGLLYVINNGTSVKELITTERGNYMIFFDELYEAIRNDNPLPVTGNEAMNVIKIIQKAIESNNQQRVVNI